MMLIRLALFASFGLAVFSGLWATWKDPTPENAAEVLQPSAESIRETDAKVRPVLEWIFSQTPDSIVVLLREAKVDLQLKLGSTTAEVPTSTKSASGYGAPPAAGKHQADPELPPGIDWYKKD